MPKVTFITFDGTPHAVEAPIGTNLMNAATDNGVPGIDGDCGGCLSCGTCHVVVDAAWAAQVGPPDGNESAMLDAAASARQPNSRLSCQITASAALDGLVLHVPAA